MRVTLKELMDKLGVSHVLGPYETFPWSYYDAQTERTCCAEVRMDPDGREIEAEIQMMHDNPPAGTVPMEQICLIKSKPNRDTNWEIVSLRIHGQPFGEDIYNWQEKSCNFFNAVVQELLAEAIPDIEDLIDREFHSRERLGDQRQGGGGKSPKIQANQLLKKSGGF